MRARDHRREDRGRETARGAGRNEQPQLVHGQRHVADRAEEKTERVELFGKMLADVDHHAKLAEASSRPLYLRISEVVHRILFASPTAALSGNEFRPNMVEAWQIHELRALRINHDQAGLFANLVEHSRGFACEGLPEKQFEIF